MIWHVVYMNYIRRMTGWSTPSTLTLYFSVCNTESACLYVTIKSKGICNPLQSIYYGAGELMIYLEQRFVFILVYTSAWLIELVKLHSTQSFDFILYWVGCYLQTYFPIATLLQCILLSSFYSRYFSSLLEYLRFYCCFFNRMFLVLDRDFIAVYSTGTPTKPMWIPLFIHNDNDNYQMNLQRSIFQFTLEPMAAND